MLLKLIKQPGWACNVIHLTGGVTAFEHVSTCRFLVWNLTKIEKQFQTFANRTFNKRMLNSNAAHPRILRNVNEANLL